MFVLIKFKLCRIVKCIDQVMNMPLYFCFHAYSREIIYVFPDVTKILSLALLQTLFKSGFSNLYYYNLAWALSNDTRLMTLSLFQGHKYIRIINCKLFFKILVHCYTTISHKLRASKNLHPTF